MEIPASTRYVSSSGVASLIYHHPRLTEVLFSDTLGALSELEAMGCSGFSLRTLAVHNRRGVNDDLDRALRVNPSFRKLEIVNTGRGIFTAPVAPGT
jgi:hypothetical protein